MKRGGRHYVVVEAKWVEVVRYSFLTQLCHGYMTSRWWKKRTLLEAFLLFLYHSWLLFQTPSVKNAKYIYFVISFLQVFLRALGYHGTFDMTCEWFNSKRNTNMGLAYAFYLPQILLMSIYQNFYRCVPYFSDSTIARVLSDYLFVSFCLYLVTIAVIAFSQTIYRSKKTYIALLIILWMMWRWGLWYHDYAYLVSCLSFVLVVFLFSQYFPNCFSIGEYSIFCQSLVLVSTFLWQRFYNPILPRETTPSEILPYLILLSSFLSCIFAVSLFTLLVFVQSRVSYFSSTCYGAFGLVVSTLFLYAHLKYDLSDQDIPFPLLWFIHYLLQKNRIFLFLWWLFISLFTVIFVVICKRVGRANTIIIHPLRKFFHFGIALCYIPGLVYDEHLLVICSAGVLWLFTVVECCRLSKFTTLSRHIQDVVNLFLKEEASSNAIVPNHFVLLLAISLPLWLIKFVHFGNYDLYNYAYRLCLLASGVVSCGIGDSFASIVGSFWGTHHILGGKKTYEGALASWTSQTLTYILIYHCAIKSFELSFNDFNFLLISFSCTAIESLTSQEDNIILPILSMSHLIAFIRRDVELT